MNLPGGAEFQAEDLDYLDYQTFLIKLLCSLSPSVPLEDNLRAVMAPFLVRLRQYSGAKVAAHVFMNPEFLEVHAMAVGEGSRTTEALQLELDRRHDPQAKGLVPEEGLPKYLRLQSPPSMSPADFAVLSSAEAIGLQGQFLWLFNDLRQHLPDEFRDLQISPDDTITVVPLTASGYPRLGCFVLWSPADQLSRWFSSPKVQEDLGLFRNTAQQLVVRLFTNFYQMEPHTYLPSYCRSACKPVALLAAEIRSFDRTAEVLRRRRDFSSEQAADCLRALIRGFTETTARVVEQKSGRVDQIWGNGALAVFGEYLTSPDSQELQASAGCIQAVLAAKEIVNQFFTVAQNWLKKEFRVDKFIQLHGERIDVAPVIAIAYGDVLFDYVGSLKHRSYMAVGDRVNFVKHLAGTASRSELDRGDPIAILREVRDLLREREFGRREEFREAPILLSQAAHTWARDVLVDPPGRPVGEVHRPHSIAVPGKPGQYEIYAVWPENIDG
jgi:class 3 adenylate cyclase